MCKITINRDKVVFINLTEMDSYEGPESNLSGGGKFVQDNGYGHEIFNFMLDDGKCYGYTPPSAKINLKRISNEINSDALGDYIDDVLVVFTCSRNSQGRLVCGFYQHARVYSEVVNDNRNIRKIKIDKENIFAEYNIICNVEDAVLISKSDRKKLLPRASQHNKIGHGQSQKWYVDKLERQQLKDELLDYIEIIVNDCYANDEYRHHLYDENKARIVKTKQIHRSQAARTECINLKGCFCNICGFDFEKVYGELGKNYIEVHHVTPVGELSTSEGYDGTNHQKDLIPLCSNCHSMIHRKKVPYQPKEIKSLLEKIGNDSCFFSGL